MNDTGDHVMTLRLGQLRSLARWLAFPLFVQLAACSGGGGASQGTLASNAALAAYEITPSTTSVPAGSKLPFVAKAHFVDGTVRDVTAQSTWTASNGALVTFLSDPGAAIAVAQGTTDVTATYQGVAATASLTITRGLLLSLTLDPNVSTIAKGTTQQYTSFAVMSDGKADVTGVATWSTSDGSVATVSSSGLVTAMAPGSVVVSASFAGSTQSLLLNVTAAALRSITINGPAGGPGPISTPLGIDVPLGVTGSYSDGSSQDLAGQVTWTSSNPGVATVDQGGVVHPVALGTTDVTAARDGVSTTITVTVTPAVLVAISVTPVAATVPKGTVLSFVATGTLSDGTSRDISTQVAWASSDPGVVSVTVAPAVGVSGIARDLGTVAITATSSQDASISGTASVTVTAAALTTIAVAPASVSVPAGTNQQFHATATYTDGSARDVTAQVGWSSSDASTASISNAVATAGLLGAIRPGDVTVTAALAGVTGSASLTVSPATLTSIAITGPNGETSISIAKGTSTTVTATGTYSDGSRQTVPVTWSSNDPGVAAVTPGGSITGIHVGNTTISATVPGSSVTAQIVVTVTPATLVSVVVSPGTGVVAVGARLQFKATGTFTDGSSQDVTATATWKVSPISPVLATISAGRLTALAVGSVTVTATGAPGKSGSASVTINRYPNDDDDGDLDGGSHEGCDH